MQLWEDLVSANVGDANKCLTYVSNRQNSIIAPYFQRANLYMGKKFMQWSVISIRTGKYFISSKTYVQSRCPLPNLHEIKYRNKKRLI